MSQTNVREGYKITTLEVIKLIEDLISYLAVAKYTQLQNAQIPKVFYKAAYGAKVKIEDLSNTLTLTLSETAQRQSSSVVSNRSTALITNKFSVALLTEPAILNNANVALVDAVHYSVIKQFPMFRLMTKESQQKLEENYFKVIDALTITLIKDDDDLLGTVNSHIKLRRLRAVILLCQTTKPLGDSNKDGPPLKRRKTEAADSRHAKASGGRTKKDKDLEDSDTSSDVLRSRRRDRAAARAQLAKRKRLGKEAQLKKTRDEEELAKAKKEKEEKEAQDDDYRLDSSSDINSEDNSEDKEATTAKDLLTDAYILYFKELLSNNSGIFTNAIGMSKTRAIVLAVLIGHFCFFSNSPPENIGRPTKEEAIEMRINTTDAISKALAAANKLVALRSYIIPEANTPAVHPKATKHHLAPSAARFVIVYSFGKIDKHIFRAYNTISVTAQRTIIRKGSPYIEKRAILLSSHALSGTPIEQGLNEILIFRNIIANVKHDASEHKSSYKYKELISQGAAVAQRFICLYLDFLSTVQNAKQQCRDILEKEGLNKSEASRRVIFNRFKMQAIVSYPALATLKAAQFKTYSSCKVKRFTLNSIKDLFTNLSKDHFLSIAAEDAAKAANTLPPLKKVRAKILIGSYKPIVQAIIVALIAFAEAITLTEATHVIIIEPQDRQNTQDQFIIVYFNPDSELELKVLGKQNVKTTSRDKLQGRGSTVTDQRID
ncbi:hypothetical protein HBI70_240700 [Parastagonospora nodorum]|nr:hypothetical protein HBI70_240700 [Parastagonospora nodorum]